MALKLTITSPQRLAAVGVDVTKQLDAGRLLIGRSVGSDWVLHDPDRAISRQHCAIEGSGDTFRLTDTSSYGVFVNDSEQPIGRGNVHLLQHGDRLRLGTYELAVEIDLPQAAPATAEPPSLGADFTSAAALFEDRSTGPGDNSLANVRPEWPPQDDRDPFAVLQRVGGAPQRLSDLDQGPPTDQPIEPQHPAAVIPEDWINRLAIPSVGGQPESAAEGAGLRPKPPEDARPEDARPADARPADARPADVRPAERPAERPAWASPPPPPASPSGEAMSPAVSAEETASALAAFLKGAGLRPGEVAINDPMATMQAMGEVFRIVTEGLIEILESRRAIKSEFRLGVTEFARVENNPLKFSLGPEETMRMLLGRPEPGYLPASKAFMEALADVRDHQVAVLAGMQQACTDLLRRFDPQDLQKRLGEDSGLGGFLASKKARCWDAFTQIYAAVAEDAERSADSLFARKFAEGYEKQAGKRRGS